MRRRLKIICRVAIDAAFKHMKTQNLIRWAFQSVLSISVIMIADTGLSNEALLEASKPIQTIHDLNFLESLTPELLSQKSDEEVAPIYVTRISGGWHNSKWVEFVDDDIMRRQGAGRILLHLLRYPNTRSVPGGLWQWLSKHPNHPATNQIIEESLERVRSGEVFSESRLVNQSKSRKVIRFGEAVIDLFSIGQLAYLLATVLDPRCEEVFNEFDKMGVALDVARPRYLSQLKRLQDSTSTNSPSTLQPPALNKELELKPAIPSPTEEPSPFTPWSIVVVLIVGATGLLWLLVKNRK